jgi:SEC-C motif
MNETNQQSPALTKPELIESFYYGEQLVLAQRKPYGNCKHCKGLGYTATLRKNGLLKSPVGPNEKCICGSGKKFKKCHQSLIDRLKMSGNTIMACGCVGYCELGSNPKLQEMRDELTRIVGPSSNTQENSFQTTVL